MGTCIYEVRSGEKYKHLCYLYCKDVLMAIKMSRTIYSPHMVEVCYKGYIDD